MTTINLRDALQEIYDRHGHLTPELVVQAARPVKHPLHALVFDRDLEEAAERYYRDRAHHLIQSVRITYTTPKGEESEVRGFHAVRTESGFAYHPAEKVVSDPVLTKIVLADMEREWRALKARYEHFQEFWQLVRQDAP